MEFRMTGEELQHYLHKPVTKYRAMPLLRGGTMPSGRVSDTQLAAHCSHVLILEDGEITCTLCPARWRNEGF